MVFPIMRIMALGVVGAVGAKVGTDHVYPWLVKNINLGKTKFTKFVSDIREHSEIIKNMEDS